VLAMCAVIIYSVVTLCVHGGRVQNFVVGALFVLSHFVLMATIVFPLQWCGRRFGVPLIYRHEGESALR